jgi:hypothetical protein
MMNKLTEDQLKQLDVIKQQGTYVHSHGPKTRIRRETLWMVLLEYLKMRGAKNFRAKNFRKEKARHMRQASMADCPIAGGQLLNAIKYGAEKGFLVQVGAHRSVRWFLSESVLKEQKHE